MTCEDLLEHATAFLDGTLGGDARGDVVDHLAGCEDCRGLVASLIDAPPEDAELTTEILKRTTGPACRSVRDRLCSSDAGLDPVEAGRVRGHLERCPDCGALGRTLSAMRVELPRLADVDHEPEFVTAVLARTIGRPRRTPLVERWQASVRHLLDRPRIALEAGFVAAMLLALPVGALRGGAAPAYAIPAVRQASGATSARLGILARTTWATTRGFVAGTFSSAAASRQASDRTDDREPGSGQERRR